MKSVLIFALFCSLGLLGQEKAKPIDPVPTLTAAENLTLDNLLLRNQLTQEQIARRQAEIVVLQRQAQDIQAEAQKVIAGLQRPGYTFDVETRKYLLKPPDAAPVTKK